MTNKYKKMRQELELSQTEMARKLKICQSTISNWESGKFKPSSMMEKRLRKLMGWPNI